MGQEEIMNPNKWSVTAAEAYQSAVGIASDAEAAAVEPLHLLKALLTSGERNINAIIERVGADSKSVEQQVGQAIARQPKVSGSGFSTTNFSGCNSARIFTIAIAVWPMVWKISSPPAPSAVKSTPLQPKRIRFPASTVVF
jgi:ATP-dependent Clp protease ATP-binding subunit ClpA